MESDTTSGAGRGVTALGWAAAAALSSFAAYFSLRYSTPIDAALPFLTVIVTAVAWAGRSWLQAAVPLLIAAENTIAHESMRLFVFGGVLAVVFAVAVGSLRWTGSEEGSAGGDSVPAGRLRACTIAVAAVLVLRWIPLEDVMIGRELLLLALAIAVTLALRATPLAVVVAVIGVFVTPAVPLRTLAIPGGVLVAALIARAYGVRRVVLSIPSAVVVAVLMLFFAWSGVVARAPLYFLGSFPPAPQTEIHVAIPPGERVTLDVPEGATGLVVSGANVAHLPAGTVLGRIAPGGATVRIGDAADWGFMRREQFYASYNALPRDPAGRIRGYGYSAWADGAGRVPLPKGARSIEVTADPTIPSDAALQVEGFELRP